MRKTLTHAVIALAVSALGMGAKSEPLQAAPSEVPENPKLPAATDPQLTAPLLTAKDVILPNHRLASLVRKAAHAVKRTFEVGPASWYGGGFDGQRTASGETFDMYDLTCAHPKLAFGTWVRVTNLKNGHAVDVRVNDRGPMVPGRIIDLSYHAAEELGFNGRGVQRVRVEVVQPKLATIAPPVLTSALR